jgi:uncharacterized cupin superfamily protein
MATGKRTAARVIRADTIEAIKGSTIYPKPFRALVAGRIRRRLGDAVGLSHFGVNLTTLEPGAASSARHWHALEDEFIYVLEGEVTLVTEAGEKLMRPGMAAGFPAGEANGHQLINRSERPVTFIEVGDRRPGEEVRYPDIDLHMRWAMALTRKDGRPYTVTRRKKRR